MKKPKLLLAALILLVGAAGAAGTRLSAGSHHYGESAMLMLKTVKGGSAVKGGS
jgi:hypothetical protein